jgi:hypothetical protein
MSWSGEVCTIRDWYPNGFRFHNQDEAACFIQQTMDQWTPPGFIRSTRVQFSEDPVNAKWDYQKRDVIRLNAIEDDEEKILPAKYSACRCDHDAAQLQQEIAAGRQVHQYQENERGEYVLICQTCGGLWDHSATDRAFKDVTSPARYYENIVIPDDLPIYEAWERKRARSTA